MTRTRIYVAAGIAGLLLFLNVLRLTPNAVEDVSQYPDMTYEQIVSEHNQLRDEVFKQPLTNWAQYFTANDRLLALEYGAKKYERTHQSLDYRYGSEIRIVLGTVNFIRGENDGRSMRYGQKYGDEFEKALKNRDPMISNLILFPKNTEFDKRFLFGWLIFQIGFIPFAFLIYAIRVKDEGGSLAFEITNPYLVLYLILWEVGLFKYRARPIKEQMWAMMQYASLVLSAVLSFGAVTLKAQTKKNEEDSSGSGNSHTLTVSGSTRYLPKYLGLNGAIFHASPVVQSSLTVSSSRGWFANYYESRPVGGPKLAQNFGQEQDYTVGYGRSLRNVNLTGAMAYYNVTPLSQIPKGDLLEANVRASISKFKLVPYLWIRHVWPIRGSPPAGTFVHVGAGWSTGKKVEVVSNSEAIFDSGAFGFHRAGLIRATAAVKMRWKKLVFELPSVAVSTPFTNPRDGRKFEYVIGFGAGFSFSH